MGRRRASRVHGSSWGDTIARSARALAVAICALSALSTLVACADGGRKDEPPPGDSRATASGPAAVERDVRYATLAAVQRLDLHRPPGATAPVPVVVLIHGGAFSGGDKSDLTWLAEELARAGLAVANINYRLSTEAVFPAAVDDARAAVRWLRANAGRYGIDPERIGAMGESAGAYLATMLGATGTADIDDSPALGNVGVSNEVQAVVSLYGPVNFLTMDDQLRSNGCPPAAVTHSLADSPESRFLGRAITEIPDQARTASPVTHLYARRPRPPYFIEHGQADCTVPHQQSLELRDALLATGEGPETTILPGVDHGNYPITQRLPRIIDFLSRSLRP